MADQSIQDVVNQTQSVGDHSPSDVPASTTDNTTTEGNVEGGVKNKDNETSKQKVPALTEGQDKTLSSLREDVLGTELTPNDAPLVRDDRTSECLESADQKQEPKRGESEASDFGGISKEGINGRVTTPEVVEECAIQQALADASGGSDTDASRPEVGSSVRSSSVKKPTSFKAVSVTKNFLAKAAGSTPPVKSAIDKGWSADFQA
jgi:hypothetical protein